MATNTDKAVTAKRATVGRKPLRDTWIRGTCMENHTPSADWHLDKARMLLVTLVESPW